MDDERVEVPRGQLLEAARGPEIEPTKIPTIELLDGIDPDAFPLTVPDDLIRGWRNRS